MMEVLNTVCGRHMMLRCFDAASTTLVLKTRLSSVLTQQFACSDVWIGLLSRLPPVLWLASKRLCAVICCKYAWVYCVGIMYLCACVRVHVFECLCP